MLAVSRALVNQADVILADELSVGLAPVIVDEIFEAVDGFRRERPLPGGGGSMYVAGSSALADTCTSSTRAGIRPSWGSGAVPRRRRVRALRRGRRCDAAISAESLGGPMKVRIVAALMGAALATTACGSTLTNRTS